MTQETDSDLTPLRKKWKYKKKDHKHWQKEKEPPTVNLADLNQLQQAAGTASSSSVSVDSSQLTTMIQYVQQVKCCISINSNLIRRLSHLAELHITTVQHARHLICKIF